MDNFKEQVCIPLSMIKTREKVEIVNKNGSSEDMRRLSDMGLCNGVEVEVIVPGNGNIPFLIGISGSRIALEPSLAEMLMVNRRHCGHHRNRNGGTMKSFFFGKNRRKECRNRGGK